MIAMLLLHIRKILRYIYRVSEYYKDTKVMFFFMEPIEFDFIFGFYAKL
jgi:hypothetical protein